jgi:hypothetical protein
MYFNDFASTRLRLSGTSGFRKPGGLNVFHHEIAIVTSFPLHYCQPNAVSRGRKHGTAPRLPGRLDQYCKLQKAATAPGLASAPGSRRATLAYPSQQRSHSGCAAVWLSAIALSERFCHTRDRHGGACDTTPQVELWQGMPDKQHPTACG